MKIIFFAVLVYYQKTALKIKKSPGDRLFLMSSAFFWYMNEVSYMKTDGLVLFSIETYAKKRSVSK